MGLSPSGVDAATWRVVCQGGVIVLRRCCVVYLSSSQGSSKPDVWTDCRVDSTTFKQTALSTFREVGMKTGGSDFVARLRLVSPSL